MGLQYGILLFRAKTIVRGSRNIELARLKKKEEEEEKHFTPLHNFLVRYFCDAFCATRSLAGHEYTQR